MKKTLITTLLTLGLAASAAAYTVGDVSYTTTTGIASMNQGDYAGFTFTLKPELFDQEATATTVASDGSSAYASTTVALASLTLTSRENDYTSPASQITISDSNGIVATSTKVTRTNGVQVRDPFELQSGYYTRTLFTWEFAVASTSLTVGTTYTVTFQNESGQNIDWGISVSDNGSLDFASITGESSMQPANMSLLVYATETQTESIPEPATATLSLLALAGLAARRRRK